MRNSAIVLGSSRIALALSERLLEDGWPLVLFGAEGAELGEAEDRLSGEDAHVLAIDLSEPEDVDELFDQAVDATGPIGLLIICLAEDDAETLDALVLKQSFETAIEQTFTAIGAARDRRADRLSVVLVGADASPVSSVLNGALSVLVSVLAEEDEHVRVNFLRAGMGHRDRQLVDAAMLLAADGATGINGQTISVGRARRAAWLRS